MRALKRSTLSGCGMRVALVLLALLLAAPAFAGAGGGGAITVFADVPDPGFPEGLVVVGDKVWTSTPASLTFGVGVGPSTLFAFDRATGALAQSIVVPEDPNAQRGLVGIAVDAQGRLYVPNVQAGLGVMRVDASEGRVEVYSPIPDIPPCVLGALAPAIVCSPTLADKPAFPNDPVFDADGNLYVSDVFQATIWRIPPGGGAPTPWLQSAMFDGIPMGANGLRISPDGARLFIALTFPSPTAVAGIYTVDLAHPSSPVLFAALDGGDGMTFGASGKLYVASAATNAIHVLDPHGAEVARYPPDPIANALLPVPMDQPASVAFLDERESLLVANHALADGALFPERWTILEVAVDDTGAPLFTPSLG